MDVFIHTLGIVPYNLTQGTDLSSLSTLVTSLFLHGGLIHIGGNMLYLWIFGNNIEGFIGSVPFILFCLAGYSVVRISSSVARACGTKLRKLASFSQES